MTTVRNEVPPRLFDVDPSAPLTFSFFNRYSPHSASTCERQRLSIAVIGSIMEFKVDFYIIVNISLCERMGIIVHFSKHENAHSWMKNNKITRGFN